MRSQGCVTPANVTRSATRKVPRCSGRQNRREAARNVQERRGIALQHADERFRHDPAADWSELVPATKYCRFAKDVVPERRLGEQYAAARVQERDLACGRPAVSCAAVMGAIPKTPPCPGRSADRAPGPVGGSGSPGPPSFPEAPAASPDRAAMKLSILRALLCTGTGYTRVEECVEIHHPVRENRQARDAIELEHLPERC